MNKDIARDALFAQTDYAKTVVTPIPMTFNREEMGILRTAMTQLCEKSCGHYHSPECVGYREARCATCKSMFKTQEVKPDCATCDVKTSDSACLVPALRDKLDSWYPVPEVGMGVTLNMYSDRIPATVIWVSPDGLKFHIQRDNWERVGKDHDIGDPQEYTYSPNPDGGVEEVRWSRAMKRWVAKSYVSVSIGYRRRYDDPEF